MVRRPLTSDERSLLQSRAAELEDCLRPRGAGENDRVALALAEMIGSFPSQQRISEEEAMGKIQTMLEVLAEYPAWSVELACSIIHRQGVLRKGVRDRQWPPSDAEVIDEIEREIKMRKTMLAQAVAILEAKVDDIDLRRIRS